MIVYDTNRYIDNHNLYIMLYIISRTEIPDIALFTCAPRIYASKLYVAFIFWRKIVSLFRDVKPQYRLHDCSLCR